MNPLQLPMRQLHLSKVTENIMDITTTIIIGTKTRSKHNNSTISFLLRWHNGCRQKRLRELPKTRKEAANMTSPMILIGVQHRPDLNQELQVKARIQVLFR
jgi:hypothetical protein